MTSAGSTVSAAEYFLDGIGADGSGCTLSGTFGTSAASVVATLPIAGASAPCVDLATLAEGSHTVSVHGRDASGAWGATAAASLVLDRTGPATSAVTLAPGAANTQAVEISATASDTATGNSPVTGGEYFVDSAGAAGTGTPMTAGAAPSTTLAGTIAAATVAALTAGNHTIRVHARDAAGNWGATATATLLVDRTAPTFSAITLAPGSITTGTASVSLAATGATDRLTGGLASGVAGGEWWIGTTNITAGTGTAFTGLAASVATGALTAGTYTVRARIRDAAGNWSTAPSGGVRTAKLTVTAPVPDAIFADGFETGTLSPLTGWTSRSTTTTSRLGVTAGAALAGAYGLQAQGNNVNYVQNSFGTAANPASPTYDARFLFNPNGATSSGKDILAAATSSGFGTVLFHVRYRLNAGVPQVQIGVGATANPAWITLAAGSNAIEVVWRSGVSLALYVNGTLAGSLAAGTGSVGAVRLGSVTSTGSATALYFDAFASKRSVAPLLGP